MEGIERVLLKMLPNQEGRNKYFIFSMQSKWEQICGANVAKHSKPVRLERKILYCLLYTSPSPRDGLLSRMPSSA